MAPSHMDYPHNENAKVAQSKKEKYNTTCYKHKKFGKRITKDDMPPNVTPLFRPYALSENTPRKRRQELQQPQTQVQSVHPQHQLPPTPPTTPPQLQPQPQHQKQHQHHHHQNEPQLYAPTITPSPTPMPTPMINHQAFAYVLQKQRAVLQIRQMLSINPDASTWPAELRNALYSMMQQ